MNYVIVHESMQPHTDGHSPCAASLCGTANHTEQVACVTVLQNRVHHHVWAEAADTKKQPASCSHSESFRTFYCTELGQARSTLRERSTKKTSIENPEWKLFGRSRRRWKDDTKIDVCKMGKFRSEQGSVASSCEHVNKTPALTEWGGGSPLDQLSS